MILNKIKIVERISEEALLFCCVVLLGSTSLSPSAIVTGCLPFLSRTISCLCVALDLACPNRLRGWKGPK
jgi:hypothetical protein